MIAVTIGTGSWYNQARAAAERMSKMTGLRTEIITAADDTFGCAHPSWLKCHIHRLFPQEDAFLVFDADVLALRPWDPKRMFHSMGRPFIGVPEPNSNSQVRSECQEWGLGFPDTYLNGGLLVFGAEHGFVWDRVWTHHPHGGRWLEQTALNHSLAFEGVEVARLPRHFNVLAQEGKLSPIYSRSTLRQAINLHTCAVATPEEVGRLHQLYLERVESGEGGRTRMDLLKELPKDSVGAEIGVFAGDFSRSIRRIVEPAKLHLVDIFDGPAISGDVNGQHMREVDLSAVRRELEAEGAPFHVHAADSLDWLHSQPTASLDWVYLDTTHEYSRTLGELIASLRVVRPGGLICGHDFSRAFPGVMQAVAEVVAEHKLELRVFDGDLLPSYAITRPLDS